MKHPNDQGYEKMANAWLKAIQEADDRGFLQEPAEVSEQDAPGTGIGIQDGPGAGFPDGQIWEKKGSVFEGFPVWQPLGTVRGPVENGRRDKVILADLNNDGIDDYILADDDGTVRAWLNGGSPNDWTSLGSVNPDWSTITGEMIRLADVDGDGRADLIALYSDGAARVWRNIDDGRKFEALDSEWATGLAPRNKVYFEDIDGDGYADYVIIWSTGAVRWARNTHNNGKDSSKKNWETDVEIAPGPAGIPLDRVKLHDLDGDGRAGRYF